MLKTNLYLIDLKNVGRIFTAGMAIGGVMALGARKLLSFYLKKDKEDDKEIGDILD